ncbi:hypothetical protein [Coleofasciculus sp. FACHB-1120]|nr:hypothetical protein [Coleofasciculus sp. FACHB-1120]MBD2739986.1 hypothetical protein [Coleofasciculus sp. FACHB-1120]
MKEHSWFFVGEALTQSAASIRLIFEPADLSVRPYTASGSVSARGTD